MPRPKDRLATRFVPFSEFQRYAAAGGVPDFCLIEPHLIAGHADSHQRVADTTITELVKATTRRRTGRAAVLRDRDPPTLGLPYTEVGYQPMRGLLDFARCPRLPRPTSAGRQKRLHASGLRGDVPALPENR